MSRFCSKHVGERTNRELVERYNKIIGNPMGPGQRAEVVRIDAEMDRRIASGKMTISEKLAKDAKPSSLFDL